MNRLEFVAAGLIYVFLITACNPPVKPAVVEKQVTPEEKIMKNVTMLKETAKSGDLLVRLNDDIISDRVRFINEQDKTYSHTGMVVERNNQKFVAHIAPEELPGDTVQYITIDSFINPAKHVSCALYRYDISEAERSALSHVLDSFRTRPSHFDYIYDITTDDKMYCSEMIYKALKLATNNRIVCRETTVPKNMQKMVGAFFSKNHFTNSEIAARKIMTIDNLYLRPDCQRLMQFPLKYFPEQVQ